MFLGDKMKRELTAKEVRSLPVNTPVWLEGRDHFGEVYQLEGKIVERKGQKIFLYYYYGTPELKEIKAYKGRKWMAKKDDAD